MRENTELKEISVEEIEEIMNKEEKLGYPEDMKVGQELIIPVYQEGGQLPVFFGALDFSGKSNKLSYEDWEKFTEEVTGFKPIDRMILKKSNKKDSMYIFAMADSSIGACNIITPFNNIFDLIEEFLSWGMLDDEEVEEQMEEVLQTRDIDKAIEICEEYFQHSFFTGLIWGGFEYVSGVKPDKQGYAQI